MQPTEPASRNAFPIRRAWNNSSSAGDCAVIKFVFAMRAEDRDYRKFVHAKLGLARQVSRDLPS